MNGGEGTWQTSVEVEIGETAREGRRWVKTWWIERCAKVVKYSSICRLGEVLGIGDDRSRVSARHRARQHASCAAPSTQVNPVVWTRVLVWSGLVWSGLRMGERGGYVVRAVGCPSLVTEWHDSWRLYLVMRSSLAE
jgi:hypothetical protein